jgi:hypothetical protein
MENKMATEIGNVGNVFDLTLTVLDQNGAVISPQPDLTGATITWSNTTPATTTLTPNGMTATDTLLAPGTDTINVTVSGLAGAAGDLLGSLPVQVSAAPSVPTTIQINATEVTGS